MATESFDKVFTVKSIAELEFLEKVLETPLVTLSPRSEEIKVITSKEEVRKLRF